jgi:hypothetical protein
LNTSLESIDLSYNQIRNRGAKSIAKVIKRSESLRDLSLAGNEIRLAGIKSIASAVSKSEAIEYLQIHSNPLCEAAQGFYVIREAVLENNTLINVFLGSFPSENEEYRDQYQDTMAEKLKSNHVLREKKRKYLQSVRLKKLGIFWMEPY